MQLPPSRDPEERSGGAEYTPRAPDSVVAPGRKGPLRVSPISLVPSGVMKGQGKLSAPCRVTSLLPAARLVPGAVVLSRRIWVGAVRILPPD